MHLQAIPFPVLLRTSLQWTSSPLLPGLKRGGGTCVDPQLLHQSNPLRVLVDLRHGHQAHKQCLATDPVVVRVAGFTDDERVFQHLGDERPGIVVTW